MCRKQFQIDIPWKHIAAEAICWALFSVTLWGAIVFGVWQII